MKTVTNNIKQIPTKLNYYNWSQSKLKQYRHHLRVSARVIIILLIINILCIGLIINDNIKDNETALNNAIIQAEMLPPLEIIEE